MGCQFLSLYPFKQICDRISGYMRQAPLRAAEPQAAQASLPAQAGSATKICCDYQHVDYVDIT